MKYKALAASISLLCAPALHAQTNITLYGIIDTGIHVSDAGNGSQVNLASGISDGSRYGLKGTEELGGGYKAIFNLEARFEADNGGNTSGYLTDNLSSSLVQGLPGTIVAGFRPLFLPARAVNPLGALFDRTAMVGLVTPAGAFLMGRQYTPAYEVAAMIDPFEAGTAAGWTNLAMGTGGIVTIGMAIRASDAVQYRIEMPGGFGAGFMYASSDTESARIGTGTGGLNYSKRLWGANIRYKAGSLNAGLGYNQETDPFGEKSLSTLTLGGSYTMDDFKLFAGYMRMRNDRPPFYDLAASRLSQPALGLASDRVLSLADQIAENTKVDADSYTAGVQYRTGAHRFTVGISRTENDRPRAAKATLYGLGYNYFLSKRTDLYAVAAMVENEGAAQYALGGAGYLGGFTSSPGEDARSLQLGIRHKF